MQKLHLALAALSLILSSTFFSGQANAAIVVAYDLSGVANEQVPFVAATTTADGITGANLTRGAGVGAMGLTNGFSANGWNGTTSLETAVGRGAYFEFGFGVGANHIASLDTLDLSLRRSAVPAPMNYRLQSSIDGFQSSRIDIASFTYFGRTSGSPPSVDPLLNDPFFYMTNDLPGRPNTTTSPGDRIPTVDLTSFSELQNLGGGSQVSFRLYAWGNDATTATNTVALGRMVGPSIGGTVSVVPEPSAFLFLVLSGLTLTTSRRRTSRVTKVL